MTAASRFERLGTERVGKLLLEMSSQTTLALLVYAIYSITDTYFLSVGINSLAAAGASIISPVLIGLGGVATTVGSGGASVVSRALGEGNPEKASRVVANTFLIFWTAAVIITVFGALFIEPIVTLLGATPTVAPYAVIYGRIIFLGAITSTGYSTIVRADGSVRFSTAMWIIPVTTNIILSWLFIMVLGMGVAGAALATVTGQAISAGMSVYFFFFRKNRSYALKAAYFKPDWRIIGEVIAIGFPSLAKSLSSSLLVMVTNNLLRAIGGDSALGVYAIVNRLFYGINTPQVGMVQGMQPILGYNYGRRYFERVRQTITYALGASGAYGLLTGALCLAFPAAMIGMLSTEPAIITEGQAALRLLAFAAPLGGIPVMVAAYFQAAGRAREALLIALGGVALVKLPVLLLAADWFALSGIWAAEAVSDAVLCAAALLMLRSHQTRLAAAAVSPPASETLGV